MCWRACGGCCSAPRSASSPASIGGFIVGLNRHVSEFLNPLVVFFNAISGIVWLPLMIGWLGIGTALAVFLIWNTVFFIVFQNTVLGVQLVPQVYEQGVQALGGGRLETIRSVILPGALPYMLTGIRSGLGFGWRALIAAELVGATVRPRADDLRRRRVSPLRHHHRRLPDHRHHRDRHGPLAAAADRAAHDRALGPGLRRREGAIEP